MPTLLIRIHLWVRSISSVYQNILNKGDSSWVRLRNLRRSCGQDSDDRSSIEAESIICSRPHSILSCCWNFTTLLVLMKLSSFLEWLYIQWRCRSAALVKPKLLLHQDILVAVKVRRLVTQLKESVSQISINKGRFTFSFWPSLKSYCQNFTVKPQKFSKSSYRWL